MVKSLPDMCRCDDALLVSSMGIVSRVQSCPVCVGKALAWHWSQLELFSDRGGVSVSAVLDSSKSSAIRSGELVVDELPF